MNSPPEGIPMNTMAAEHRRIKANRAPIPTKWQSRGQNALAVNNPAAITQKPNCIGPSPAHNAMTLVSNLHLNKARRNLAAFPIVPALKNTHAKTTPKLTSAQDSILLQIPSAACPRQSLSLIAPNVR